MEGSNLLIGIKVTSGPSFGDRIRLITRGRLQLDRPLSVDRGGARKNRHRQFVIDGEAVMLGVDGVADFSAAAFAQARP